MTARQQARQAIHSAWPCLTRRDARTGDAVSRPATCRLAPVALSLASVFAVIAAAPATAAEQTPPVTIESAASPAPAVVAPAVDGWTSRTDQPSAASAEAVPVANQAPALALEVDDHAQFERALGAIEAGKPLEGQRLLEQLVARSPASPIADDARRRLAEIYAHAFAVSPAASANVAATPADATGAAAAAGATTASIAPAVEPQVIDDKPAVWRDRARRTHRFEGMLGAEVGDRVFFGVSSSDVGTRARNVLERQARWINRFPDLYVIVEGHADEPGDDAQNRALSLQRADKARRMLVESGLSAERIDIDARGRQDRVADCDSASCQAQNRRVVTRLMVVLPHGRERSSAADGAVPMAR